MAAYLIADIDVTDADTYARYRDEVPALIAAHGGRYLARGGASETLDGTWAPRRAVIVEFPSMKALRAFWDSSEYRVLREVRLRATQSNVVAVEGMPQA